MFYPIFGHVIILNFKNLYLKWNKSRVVSKYHDCQVIHSSCSIVASTYIVTCRRWLFSLPLIVMFVNWQTAQYLTDDAAYTFQGLIINVSFNDLLLHNLFILIVQYMI